MINYLDLGRVVRKMDNVTLLNLKPVDSGYDSLDFTYPLESDLISDCAIQRLNRRGLKVEKSDGRGGMAST